MQTIKSYKLITITHKYAPLKSLGQYVLPESEDALAARLEAIKQQLGIGELLYLATCNRITFLVTSDVTLDEHFTAQFVETVYNHLDTEAQHDFANHAKTYEGLDAVRHLFEVASSIDSLVVGEREILRQLRTAYQQCLDWKLTGDSIRLLMRFTVEMAKKIYAKTRIGEKPVSVVSLAVQQMLKNKIAKDARFLLIGAGQTNTLVTKFLTKQGFTNYTVVNRTLNRAEELANTIKGKALALADLPLYTEGFDVMIACTGATEAVVTPELYTTLLQGDTSRKILLDLSIPNNIHADIVANSNNVYTEIADLNRLAEKNLAFRQQEVGKAQQMIEADLVVFEGVFKERQVEKAMRAVPQQIKAIRQHAVSQVFKKEMESLDDDAKAILDKMMTYMEKRCIAIPLQVAKESFARSSS